MSNLNHNLNHDHHILKDSHNMKMYFHFGLGDTILFENIVLKKECSLWIACIVFFFIAILYEGLKCLREYLLHRTFSARSYQVANISGAIDNTVVSGFYASGEPNSNNGLASGTHFNNVEYVSPIVSNPLRRMCSGPHVQQSILHVLQVAISYTLMLGFMTFNVCLCFAILFGAGVGYFLFCWRKLTYVNVTEHCH